MHGVVYPKFRSPEALQYAVDLYFDTIEQDSRPPTMAGMALSLGFRSRQSLKNYEVKNDDYACVLETARTRVEMFKNEMLLDKTAKNGNSVFLDLCNNHAWSAKAETKVEHSATGSLEELLRQLQGSGAVLRPIIESTATHLPSIEDLI